MLNLECPASFRIWSNYKGTTSSNLVAISIDTNPISCNSSLSSLSFLIFFYSKYLSIMETVRKNVWSALPLKTLKTYINQSIILALCSSLTLWFESKSVNSVLVWFSIYREQYIVLFKLLFEKGDPKLSIDFSKFSHLSEFLIKSNYTFSKVYLIVLDFYYNSFIFLKLDYLCFLILDWFGFEALWSKKWHFSLSWDENLDF